MLTSLKGDLGLSLYLKKSFWVYSLFFSLNSFTVMKSPSFLLLQVPTPKPLLTCFHFLLIPKVSMETLSFIQKALFGPFLLSLSHPFTHTYTHILYYGMWKLRFAHFITSFCGIIKQNLSVFLLPRWGKTLSLPTVYFFILYVFFIFTEKNTSLLTLLVTKCV